MKIMQDFVEQLTGQEIVDELVTLLIKHVDGFQEDYHRYLAAVKQLKAELSALAVDEVISAIHRRISSDLLFSAFLGLKMNLDHFINPMAPNCTWPQVDFDDYLQVSIAHNLPAYALTEATLSNFYNSLSPKQNEIYRAIAEYESYLETSGPKLAHYYGYLLGDTLLPQIIPGYHPDPSLILRYQVMLANYFGKQCLFSLN